MNEQLIRELHHQAWDYTYPKAISVTETPIDFQQVLRQKFVEVIVKECMIQCYKVQNEMDGATGDGAELCYEAIKQHFGVEE